MEIVPIIQERFQQSIEEQIIDAPEIVDSPVPQVVEEQLVAVAPTPATTDATFPHEKFDELCTIMNLKQAELRYAELVVQRLDIYAANILASLRCGDCFQGQASLRIRQGDCEKYPTGTWYTPCPSTSGRREYDRGSSIQCSIFASRQKGE